MIVVPDAKECEVSGTPIDRTRSAVLLGFVSPGGT
jgi:hypothetical protein